MMRKALMFALAMTALACVAGVSHAQVYFMYPGAPPVPGDQPAVGANIGIGDDVFRLLGYTRFNINEVSDLGIELVLDNGSSGFGGDSWRVGAGGDYKYMIVPQDNQLPFDLAVGGGFGFQTGGDVTNFNILGGGLVSRPLEMNNGKIVVPYGGLYLIYSHTSFDNALVSTSDNDLDVEVRGGASISFSETLRGYITLHIGSNFMAFFGLNVAL